MGAVHKIDNLATGMAGRTLISQAQGIAMARHGIDAEPAWRAMVRISQDTNIKIRDLAAEIIRARQLPGLQA